MLYRQLATFQGITKVGHFNAIGKLFNNKSKIDRLLNMDDNKCYEIESYDGYNIAIICKNNILHITQTSHEIVDINFVIENINSNSQLSAIADFFSSDDVAVRLQRLIELSPENYLTWTAKNIKYYGFKKGQTVYLSGNAP